MKTDATLLANNSQHCWMLHVASVCTPCCMLLDVVARCCAKFETGQTFQPITLFILFCYRRSVARQCWIRLHGSSNIVDATYAHYAWITKTYGLYSSHDALHVPNLLGVVASVCTLLPTRTQQLRTLLRLFARSLTHLELKRQKRSYTSAVPLKTISDSRPKWAKCIPVFRPRQRKSPTQWGGTYLYSLYKGILLRGKSSSPHSLTHPDPSLWQFSLSFLFNHQSVDNKN